MESFLPILLLSGLNTLVYPSTRRLRYTPETEPTTSDKLEYDSLMLEPRDVDPDFARADTAESRIRDLFEDFVGAEDLVEKLVGYSRVVQRTKARDMDPREHIPFNYLFRGHQAPARRPRPGIDGRYVRRRTTSAERMLKWRNIPCMG